MSEKQSSRILSLPCQIGNYEFVRRVGKGGFSSVYLVTSPKSTQPFVAKISTSKPKERKAYDSEVKSLMKLNHPNIIRFYDHFLHQDYDIIILEYCPKGNLKDQMPKGGYPIDRFVHIAKQVISALKYCHQNGIAHHDIKLENVLIDQYGRCKLADFGLAIKTNGSKFHASYSGSLYYCAPELFLQKPYDPFKSDIWALGVLFMYLLGGNPPWNAHDFDTLKRCVISGIFEMPSGVPSSLSQLIRSMMKVNPDHRITIEEIAGSPIFKENIASTAYTNDQQDDILSPRSRQRTNLFTDAYSSEGKKHEFSKSLSKAIILSGKSTIRGVNKPMMLRPRPCSLVTFQTISS